MSFSQPLGITKKVRIPRVGAIEYSFCFVIRLREFEQESSPSPYELIIECDGERAGTGAFG